MFIIIHVSEVEVGIMKGPATSPVKVYADKFMVQMENQASKKDVSFRVPGKQIISLNVGIFVIKLEHITGFETRVYYRGFVFFTTQLRD